MDILLIVLGIFVLWVLFGLFNIFLVGYLERYKYNTDAESIFILFGPTVTPMLLAFLLIEVVNAKFFNKLAYKIKDLGRNFNKKG